MDAYKGLKGFGGGAAQPHHASDTLFSDDIVEIILGLSEGPIVGLENGAASFMAGDTPLIDAASKSPNIGNFELTIHKGNNPPEKIVPKLGGNGVSHQVGVPLEEPGVEVTRQGTQANIDFLEVRIAISRLVLVSDNEKHPGEYPTTVEFDVAIKPVSATSWTSAYGGQYGAPYVETANLAQYNGQSTVPGSIVNPAYRETYIQTTAPTAIGLGAIWFDRSKTNWPPKLWNGSSWVNPPNLTSSQPANELFRWQWTDGNTTRRAFYSPAGDHPIGYNQYDFLLTPAGVGGSTTPKSYIHNGSSWVNYMDWAKPPTSGVGVISVTGKTTSTYVKELRIPVKRINEPYQIRVSRVSQKNTTTYFADLSFESFQELTRTPFEFPNLACAHLTVKASDQFTSLPEFTGIYKGRIIRVPTNYNPVTKTYSGLWDGTFKYEYTDNPAWVIYDLVMDDTYGMNAYYPIVLDKFATYDFARHCDTFGFTYNDYVQEARSLSETVNFIAGLAGGRFIDQGDGFATIIYDADAQPATAIFTPENVIDGVFTYSFTDITARKNDFTVSFVNPEIGWREDRIRVFDQAAIEQYGRNPEEFIAVGCISEAEAVKRGRMRLATALTEKTIVSFKTNRMGLYLKPFEVILVSDDDMNSGISGRVKSVLSPTTLLLRDPIFFEAGLTYLIKFQVPNGSTYNVVTYTLAPMAGNTTVLTLATPLTVELPEKAVFTIEQAQKVGVPKAFRITGIEEVDGEPDNIGITAIEVNRQKWAFVNGEVTLRNVVVTGRPSNYVNPVANPRVTPTDVAGRHNLFIEWDPSPYPLLRFYRIYMRANGGDVQVVGEPRQPRFQLEGIQAGTYIFSIVAVSIEGQESPPVTFEHLVSGSMRTVSPPTNLRLIDEPDLTTFASRSPLFRWDASPDPFLSDYMVEIIDPSSSNVVRTVYTTITDFQYTWEMNAQDNGGLPRRSFRIRVRARDNLNNLSATTGMIASNPQIAPPVGEQLKIYTYLFNLYVEAQRPTDPAHRDFAGMRVRISNTPGFDPITSGTMMYDGVDTVGRGVIRENEKVYARVAFYDSFRSDDALWSEEISVIGKGLNPGTISFDNLTSELGKRIEETPELREVSTHIFESMVHAENNDKAISATKVELTEKIENETEARVRDVDGIFTKFNETSADIQTVREAVSTETEARATQINQLKAQIDGEISAQILEVQEAVATETEARTTQINQLKSQIDTDITAQIQTVQTAVATETEARATAVTNLRTELNGNISSNVSTLQKAISDGDKAVADTVTTLSGRVGTTEGTISQHTSTIATLNQKVTQSWMVKMEAVNGQFYKISGFGLAQTSDPNAPDGFTSDFVVQADQFSIVPPVTRPDIPQNKNPVFIVGTKYGVASVGINGNMFLTGTITADALEVNHLRAYDGTFTKLTSGTLQSPNGRMTINLADGWMAIYG
jgi:predicted phage tail protein